MSEQKTEAPTDRRRHEARKKGEGIGRSHELTMGITLGVGLMVITSIAPGVVTQLSALMRGTIIEIGSPSALSHTQLVDRVGGSISQSVFFVLPLAAAIILGAVISSMAAGGFVVSMQRVKPDLKRLNPLSGMKRIADKQALFRLGIAVVKLTVVSFMAYQVIVSGAKAISFYGKIRVSSPRSAYSILPEKVARDRAATMACWEKARDRNHRFWEGFKPVIRELGDMAPVFAAPDADWKPAVASGGLVGGSDRAIESRVKQLDASTWVILMVNNSNGRNRIQLSLPPAHAGGAVYIWPTGQPLAVDTFGRLADQIDPFGVRVYSNQERSRWGER